MGPAVWAMFALWLGYGAWQWKRSDRLLARVTDVPSGKRVAQATLWLFGGAGALLAVLYGVFRAGGFPPGSIAPWAWAVCAAAGLGFVHAQVMAGALLIGGVVTPGTREPSHTESPQSRPPQAERQGNRS